MSVLTIVAIFFTSSYLPAQDPTYLYAKNLYGHVRQTPQKASVSLTTVQCGHPMKVIDDKKILTPASWYYIQVADHKGFIHESHVAKNKPDCLQNNYLKFFDALNLDLAQLYYWGRLYDHLEQGKVTP